VRGETAHALRQKRCTEPALTIGGTDAERLDLTNGSVDGTEPPDAEPGQAAVRVYGDEIAVFDVMGRRERPRLPCRGHILAVERCRVQDNVGLHLDPTPQRAHGEPGRKRGAGFHRSRRTRDQDSSPTSECQADPSPPKAAETGRLITEHVQVPRGGVREACRPAARARDSIQSSTRGNKSDSHANRLPASLMRAG
jgi:hypothetical protein